MMDGGGEQFSAEAELFYHRLGRGLRLRMRGMTNHELRNVLIGLWLSLDEADRRDHIEELRHYLEPDSRPPGVALEMALAIAEGRAERQS